MNASVMKEWPYQLLDRSYHGRLVENASAFTREAGISMAYLDTPMAKVCEKDQIDWVKNYRQHLADGSGGFIYIGNGFGAIVDRMSVITAAFLRNYIDARMLTIKEVTDGDNALEPTVLLVPDFHTLFATTGSPLPAWQIQTLYSIILGRYMARKISVLYTENFKVLKSVYGSEMYTLLKAHWSGFENKKEADK